MYTYTRISSLLMLYELHLAPLVETNSAPFYKKNFNTQKPNRHNFTHTSIPLQVHIHITTYTSLFM